MLELRKYRSRLRPLIAIVAAYALALQVLLSGLAGAHAMADAPGSGDLFVICHGSGGGSAEDQNLPDKPPLPNPPCVLCTLTNAPCAVLPFAHSIATIDVVAATILISRNETRIIEFVSPTGRYERGPPAGAPFSADPLNRSDRSDRARRITSGETITCFLPVCAQIRTILERAMRSLRRLRPFAAILTAVMLAPRSGERRMRRAPPETTERLNRPAGQPAPGPSAPETPPAATPQARFLCRRSL